MNFTHRFCLFSLCAVLPSLVAASEISLPLGETPAVLVQFRGALRQGLSEREALHRRLGTRLLEHLAGVPFDRVAVPGDDSSWQDAEAICRRYRSVPEVVGCFADEAIPVAADKPEEHVLRSDPGEHGSSLRAVVSLEELNRDRCGPPTRLVENLGGERTYAPRDWALEMIGGDPPLMDEIMGPVKGTSRFGLFDEGFDLDHLSDLKRQEGAARLAIDKQPLGPGTKQVGNHGTMTTNLINGTFEQDGASVPVGPGRNGRLAFLSFAGRDSELLKGFAYLKGMKDKPKILNASMTFRSQTSLKVLGALMSGEDPFEEDVKKKKFLDENKRIIVVVSAGNAFPLPMAPLYHTDALKDLIVAGAVGPFGYPSPFSQRDEAVTVLAPGESLSSVGGPKGLEEMAGTSASAPLVSGALSNLVAQVPDLSPAEAKALVAGTAQPPATPVESPAKDGAGILNAYALAVIGPRLQQICRPKPSEFKTMEACRKDWISGKNKKAWKEGEGARSLFDFKVEAEAALKKAKELMASWAKNKGKCDLKTEAAQYLRRAFLLSRHKGASKEEQEIAKNAAGQLADYYQSYGLRPTARYYASFRTGITPTAKDLAKTLGRTIEDATSISETLGATRALASLGPDGRAEVEKLAKSETPRARLAAGYGARHFLAGDADDRRKGALILKRLLDDENPAVRGEAVSTLAEAAPIAPAETVPLLGQALRKDPELLVRVQALKGLIKLRNGGQGEPELSRLLHLQQADVLRALTDAIDPKNEVSVRKEAAELADALGPVLGVQLAPFYRLALRESDLSVRRVAFAAVMRGKSAPGLALLDSLMQDKTAKDENRLWAAAAMTTFDDKGMEKLSSYIASPDLARSLREPLVREVVRRTGEKAAPFLNAACARSQAKRKALTKDTPKDARDDESAMASNLFWTMIHLKDQTPAFEGKNLGADARALLLRYKKWVEKAPESKFSAKDKRAYETLLGEIPG